VRLLALGAARHRVNTGDSSLAQIVAIFTGRCDDVHAAREWILMEHVTGNEQYPRVFPAGCKVPIKMQILQRHLRPSWMVGRSLTDVFTHRCVCVCVSEKGGDGARGGNRFMCLCMKLVLHHRATSHTYHPPFGRGGARDGTDMTTDAISIRGVRHARTRARTRKHIHPVRAHVRMEANKIVSPTRLC
jgi:hypothetical protein